MSQQWDYRGFVCEIYVDGDDDNRYKVAMIYNRGKAINVPLRQSQMNQKSVNEYIDRL